MTTHHQLKIIQWNARGLNKSKLTEFKANLDTLDPTMVLLSETHRNNQSKPSFSNYNLVFKNRPGIWRSSHSGQEETCFCSPYIKRIKQL